MRGRVLRISFKPFYSFFFFLLLCFCFCFLTFDNCQCLLRIGDVHGQAQVGLLLGHDAQQPPPDRCLVRRCPRAVGSLPR